MVIGVGTGSALFDRYEPSPGVEPRALNRHGILHGAARRYGTELNATKLYLLLVVIAESVQLYEEAKLREERERERRKAKRSSN